MKTLITDNAIISLENVRRVEKIIFDTNHTSRGEKYTIRHYEINITYCNQTAERIKCGNNTAGEKSCAEYFQTIYRKLSEG